MTFRAPIIIPIVARQKAQPEFVVNVFPLLHPNPARPFVQSDWPRALDPRPPLKSEVYFGAFPLYSPNPVQPFAQYEWRVPARIPLSLKSDVYSWIYPLYSPNPSQPFGPYDWFQIRSTQKAKVDDFVNLVPYQQVVSVSPFVQGDWPLATTARPKIGEMSITVSAPLSLGIMPHNLHYHVTLGRLKSF